MTLAVAFSVVALKSLYRVWLTLVNALRIVLTCEEITIKPLFYDIAKSPYLADANDKVENISKT